MVLHFNPVVICYVISYLNALGKHQIGDRAFKITEAMIDRFFYTLIFKDNYLLNGLHQKMRKGISYPMRCLHYFFTW